MVQRPGHTGHFINGVADHPAVRVVIEANIVAPNRLPAHPADLTREQVEVREPQAVVGRQQQQRGPQILRHLGVAAVVLVTIPFRLLLAATGSPNILWTSSRVAAWFGSVPHRAMRAAQPLLRSAATAQKNRVGRMAGLPDKIQNLFPNAAAPYPDRPGRQWQAGGGHHFPLAFPACFLVGNRQGGTPDKS